MAFAVPDGGRVSAIILDRLRLAIPCENGVAAFDVAEFFEDGFGGHRVTAGAEVPLEVADPENKFRERGGARVQFDAEKLVGIDGVGGEVEEHVFPKAGRHVEDFAFEAFEVFERDVEEVAGPAGWVEDGDFAELVVKPPDLVAGLVKASGLGVDEGGSADGVPFGAEGFDDGREDEAFDVGAGRVVGSELVAFPGVECAFEQGAEDRGFDVLPLHRRGLDQDAELRAVERKDRRILEDAAVEAEELLVEDDREFGAGLHLGEEGFQLRHEALGRGTQAFQQPAKTILRQQPDILGEHAEQAAGEEFGDEARSVSGLFQRRGEDGQVSGDLAGDGGADLRGVEGERVEPDPAEAFADGFLREIREPDAEPARVGEGEVGFPGLREVGKNLEAVADIDDEKEWRVGLVNRERAGVSLGLPPGFEHGIVPCVAAANGSGFFL